MAGVFIVVWFEGDSLERAGFGGRSGIEDDLSEALEHARLGEVTGGGGGIYGSNIDIEIEDEQKFEQALTLIRRVLRDLKIPADTRITRYEPEKVVYSVYD